MNSVAGRSKTQLPFALHDSQFKQIVSSITKLALQPHDVVLFKVRHRDDGAAIQSFVDQLSATLLASDPTWKGCVIALDDSCEMRVVSMLAAITEDHIKALTDTDVRVDSNWSIKDIAALVGLED